MGDLIGESQQLKVNLRHCNPLFFGKINVVLWWTQAEQVLTVSTSALYVVRLAWRTKTGIFKGILKYFQAMYDVYFIWASQVLKVFSNVNLNCCFRRFSVFLIYWVFYPLVLISWFIFYSFWIGSFLTIVLFLSVVFWVGEWRGEGEAWHIAGIPDSVSHTIK